MPLQWRAYSTSSNGSRTSWSCNKSCSKWSRGEYLSKELQKEFSRCLIVHELTASYSAHWSGFAKRMNRTLLSLVRLMLH